MLMGDLYKYCISSRTLLYNKVEIVLGIYNTNRRGFLCVARSWLDGQMPEPQAVERVTGKTLHAFFIGRYRLKFIGL